MTCTVVIFVPFWNILVSQVSFKMKMTSVYLVVLQVFAASASEFLHQTLFKQSQPTMLRLLVFAAVNPMINLHQEQVTDNPFCIIPPPPFSSITPFKLDHKSRELRHVKLHSLEAILDIWSLNALFTKALDNWDIPWENPVKLLSENQILCSIFPLGIWAPPHQTTWERKVTKVLLKEVRRDFSSSSSPLHKFFFVITSCVTTLR